MCGICGICDHRMGLRRSGPELEAMKDELKHRGPDGDGVHLADDVALGHRRLTVIDAEAGGQPMYNEDRSLVIVFNGEIYNYVELKRDLEGAGHVFRTRSDTEVILHAYEAQGPRCVDQFNGMFAFALWDDRAHSLLLVRDRLGKKPLYYRCDGGRLTFASELKALLRLDPQPPQVSLEALDDYLAYGYVPGEKCIVQGIRKLSPGCRLLWKDGRTTLTRYWEVSFSEAPMSNWVELQERLTDELRRAVRVRLRSDVPLGAFLSGGIDSSAVVALASAELSHPIKTFSVGFSENDFDERPHARRVAEHFSTEHHEIVVRDGDLSVLPDLVYHLDEPLADPSVLPTYYVCREARRQVTVCLAGDGGDEVFGGYRRYVQAARPDGWGHLARVSLKRLSAAAVGVLPSGVRGYGTLEQLATDGAERYAKQVGIFGFRERRALLDLQPVQPRADAALFSELFDDGHDLSLVSTLQRVDQKTYLPDDILVKVDRMSMRNSLEVRSPFLDHRLVELANSLAPEAKVRRGVSKFLLRRVLTPWLPPEIVRRPKRGFGLPIKRWFRDSLYAQARDLLCSAGSRSAQWLAPRAIERVVEAHRTRGADWSQKLWALLVWEHWCRRFGV